MEIKEEGMEMGRVGGRLCGLSTGKRELRAKAKQDL